MTAAMGDRERPVREKGVAEAADRASTGSGPIIRRIDVGKVISR
jgi:hypothetical protein